MKAPNFDFRRLAAKDLPMLAEWIARPHVAEWWNETPTVDELREEYLPSVENDSFHAYIVYRLGKPIGFIQSYVAARAGDGWWPDETDPGVVGIDQFLADGNTLSEGIGTAMVSAFVELLFRDPAVTRIQVDPEPVNGRAIRCYEKVGFRRAGEIDTPDGRAVLMTLERRVVS